MGQLDIDYYCRTYRNFMSASECEEYIEKYEETLNVDAEKQKQLSICRLPGGGQMCGYCNCMRINPQEYERFETLNNTVILRFEEVLDQYKQDINIHKTQWPKKYGYEEMRIKRFLIEGGDKDNDYLPNNYHGLQNHVDIYSYAHAKRFLCLMIYLNDDFDDGQTIFPLFNKKVKPEQGMMFIFPPTWTYLHSGARPIKNEKTRHGAKYFLMLHLNYIDLTKVNEYSGSSFSRDKPAREPMAENLSVEELQWPKA